MIHAASLPGFRDTRIRVYEQANTVTEGFQSSAYQFVGEFWGHITEEASRQQTAPSPQSHLDYRLQSVALFDAHVNVPLSGLLRDETGVYYFVRGVTASRVLGSVKIALEKVSTDRFKSFVIVDTPLPVTDEFHTVDPIPIADAH